MHRAAAEPDRAAATEVALLVSPAEEGLPDDAVRRWLAIASMPGDLAGAGALRDQIHQVERALPWLTDPELVAGVRTWAEVRPRLLAD